MTTKKQRVGKGNGGSVIIEPDDKSEWAKNKNRRMYKHLAEKKAEQKYRDQILEAERIAYENRLAEPWEIIKNDKNTSCYYVCRRICA